MVRPSRRGKPRPLRASEVSVGVVDGDDIDWPTGTQDDPGTAGDFELNIEGGQSVISAHGSMGSTETFDPTDGNVQTGTLTADCTVTLNAPTGTGAATLELWLTEDGTGGWDVIWPGSVTEEGTHDTTASTTQRVLLESIDGGTSWIATWIGAGTTPVAADIAIADAGGYYTGTDVEAALQEIGADLAASGSGAVGSDHAHVMDILFSGDGSTMVFNLPASPVDAYSVAAYVAGVLTEVTLSGSMLDVATFGSAPGSASNNVRFDIVAAVL